MFYQTDVPVTTLYKLLLYYILRENNSKIKKLQWYYVKYYLKITLSVTIYILIYNAAYIIYRSLCQGRVRFKQTSVVDPL
jgi:hypothetical protein